MAVMTAVLVVPGLLVGLAARLPIRSALAVSPAVTYGVASIAAYLFGLAGIGWSVPTAAAATGVLVLLVLVVHVVVPTVRHRRLPRPDARRNWWALLPAAAVTLAAWFVGQAILQDLVLNTGGTENVFQGWDAHWHVDYIRFIHDLGHASPDDAGELRYPENHSTLYYPSTWHALAASVMGLTGASAVETYNLMQVGTLAIGFPLGVAALVWGILHRVCSRPTVATAAALGALLTPLFPGLPYVEIMVAATPSAAAAALSGLVFAAVMAALADRRYVVVAMLALIGIGGVHPSALATTVFFTVFWWLLRGLWAPVRTRLRDLAALAAIAAVGALALVPQFLTVSQEADDISAFEFQVPGDRGALWGKAVGLQVRHVADFGVRWVLLSLAVVGVLFLLRRRLVWPVLLWGALLTLCVNAMGVFGNWTGGWLRAVGSVYYNDPRRIGVVLAVLVAAAAGIGVGALAQGLAGALGRLVDPLTDARGRGPLGARVAVALASAVAVCAWTLQVAPEYAQSAGTSQRWGRLVDEHDLRAFQWLAQQPHARDGLIYTNPDEGSGWMYAVEGLPSSSRHYLRPTEDVSPQIVTLFQGLEQAGSNDEVDQALADLGVNYVYISPPNYWGNQPPNKHLLELDSTPSLEKVYSDMQVRIFAVRKAFTDTELQQILDDSPFPPGERPQLTRDWAAYGRPPRS